MARIAGVNIPSDKPLHISLRYVYGIGPSKSLEVCKVANVDPVKRVSALSEQEVVIICKVIDAHHKVEGDLRREEAMNKKRLMDLGCYRGLRHRKNLPTRGQRTHSNARTRRGRARAIAGKKG